MKSNKLEMEYGFEDGCHLSESQLNVYLDESVNDMGTSYNIPFKIKFSKPYSAVEIKEAIYKLAEIFPVLAARIVVVEDNLSFRFDEELQISVGSLDDVDSFVQPFELDKCLSIFLIIEEESILCIDCHHLILDGASRIILLNKLSDILEGTAIDSVDYGVFKQLTFEENLSSEDLNQSKEFFDIMLSDMDEVYDLMPSIAKDKCDGEHYCDFNLDSSYLKSFLEDHSITYTQFFTSVFAYTLSRFTGSSKVFFNLIVNGRSHVDLTDSVGMFVRTLPLLFNCENQKIDSFLTDSSALIKSAMKYDFYPYSQLVNEYGFSSDILFQYAYNIIYNTNESKNIVSFEDLEHDEVGDLSFFVLNHENYFKIRVTYSDKYSKELIEHFVESYKSIAHEIINKKSLNEINYITDSDLNRLDSLNKTETELRHNDILDAFNDNLAKYPYKNFVSFDEMTYTYAEGAFIADKIAKSLKDLGVESQDPVAFLTERCEYYIFAVLGIMSIGAVYVPLDDAHPDERIKFILGDTRSKVIIVSDETYGRAKKIAGDSILLNINDIIIGENIEDAIVEGGIVEDIVVEEGIVEDIVVEEGIVEDDIIVNNFIGENLGKLSHLPIAYGDIACILYTSGTTGIPKGVRITRKSVLNLATVYQDKYGISNEDVYGLFSTIGFDAALLAIMVVLYSGSCLSVIPNDLRLDMKKMNDYFITQNITHTLITTQVGRLFMRSVEKTSLKILLVGGEKLGEFETPEDYILVDAFGPTETCVFISSIRNDEKIDPSSIGPLGYNTKAYVLDKELRPVPIGAVGELCIAGQQVADGYLNREDETAQAFIKNPFISESDRKGYGRLYRTGDMVRILPDGTLGVVGRLDSQVKIRGNRVELSEIEKTIGEMDIITDVTVQTVKNGSNNELVAYVVSTENSDDIKELVCSYVASNKPDYMIPTFVIELDEIPLNVNGKVDKRALPKINLKDMQREYVAPRNEIERDIVNAFERIFEQENIGICDDFLQLGGDSLAAIKLISLLKDYDVTVADILSLHTPYAIAKVINEISLDLDTYSLESGCPLNEPQLNVYLDIIANDKWDSYRIPIFMEISKDYDSDIIQSAINEILDIHPILGMCVSDDFEVPYLVKGSKCPILQESEIEDEFLLDFLSKPFELNQNLSRFLIVENEDNYSLFGVFHHIIFDGLSESVFKEDFQSILDGKILDVDDSFLKVSAFAEQIKDAPEYKIAYDFYERFLADIDEVGILLDSVSSEGAGILQTDLNIDSDSFHSFLLNYNLSENVFFISAFAYTLSRFVGNEKVLFNILDNGRGRFKNFDAIGMYVNTLPMLADCKNQDISAFMDYMSDLIYDVMKYDYYPFRLIANEYNVNSNILFQFIPDWIEGNNVNGEDSSQFIEENIFQSLLVSNVDFSADVLQKGEDYSIRVSYSDKYSKDFIKHFVHAYKLIAEQIINANELGDIEYANSKDIELLDEYNNTEHSLVYDDVLDAFNDNLLNYPENVLVIGEEKSYTMSESAFIANEIAISLKELGVESNDFVAFVCERSELYLFNVLSILSIGATPVPVDSSLPNERIKFILENSNSKAIITDDTTYDRVCSLIENIGISKENNNSDFDNENASGFDDGSGSGFDDENGINVLNESCILKGDIGNLSHLPVEYGDLAGILYTSGTTGVPKGVKITRKSVLNLSAHYTDAQNLTCDDVYALYPSIGFDAGYKSIFKVLYTGASLVIVPDSIKYNMAKLNDYFIDNNVGHVFITTQVSKLFMQSIDKTSIKVLSVGGEKLGDLENPEDFIVMDDYGPTEAFAFISSIDVSKRIDSSSIGVLNYNSKAYVLDSEYRPVPFGAVGELYLSGSQIADGYLNRDEETEHAFLENPFSDNDDYGVMYRTGDLVRFLPDGTLGIVGRRDGQVKIRGNRVELSEVESAIREIDFIEDLTVQTIKNGTNNELVAYVVVNSDIVDIDDSIASENGAIADVNKDIADEDGIDHSDNNSNIAKIVSLDNDIKDEIIEYVANNKPDYMVPSFIIGLEEIPLNVNGKVDKRVLPEVDFDSLHTEYVAATNETESIIMQAFESVFNQKDIGLFDDFVRLGGDSITAIRLISLLEQNGISCTARSILDYKTPYLVAQHIEKIDEIDYDSVEGEVNLLPIQSFFFDQINIDSFTQEFVLKANVKLDKDVLQDALNTLSNVHDMLRAIYSFDENHNPIQYVQPVDTCVFEVNEYSIGDNFDERMRDIFIKSINSINIKNHLLDVNLIHHNDISYIVFVIHHLIIDGVSWNTLLVDLTYSYFRLLAGKEIGLTRPYPFKDWVGDVEHLVESISDEEKQYWMDVHDMWDDSLIKGHTNVFVFNVDVKYDADNVLKLTEEEYWALAIARAYKKTFGEDVIFNRESHGRDDGLANLNRSIGWFTSQYPMPIEVNGQYDGVSLMRDVYNFKTSLKDVNNLGLNYSSLIYIAHEFEYKHAPVTFNFLSSEFVFKNELFESINHYLSSISDIHYDKFDSESYGISFNVSRHNDVYIITGDYAEDTYIGDKYNEFVENVRFELDFLADYEMDTIICSLSEPQMGVYLDEKVHDKDTAYSVSGVLKCGGDKSIGEIEDAINALIEKHPILKGRILDTEDMPLLVCDNNPSIEVLDVDIDVGAGLHGAAGVHSQLSKPFDLERTLARFSIIGDSSDRYVFYDLHHLIADASSCGIIEKDFYDALDGVLDDSIDLGFVDASYDFFDSKFRDEYKSAKEFFVREFEDIDEVANLINDVDGSVGSVSLPIRGIKDKIEWFARENGITVSILFNAVFAYTLSRFTGSDKVYYTFAEHGRYEDYSQDAVGMFVRVIPIIVDCRDKPVKEFVSDVSDLVLESMSNGIYPFRLIAREFDLTNDVSFEYNLDLNDVSDIGDDIVFSDIADRVSEFSGAVIDLDDGYLLSIDHSDKFSQNTAERFANVFKEVLIQISEKESLGDIDYVSNDDLKLLNGFNQTETPLSYDDILDAFNDNLSKHSSNPLVACNDVRYSYGEGAFIADKIRENLIDLGVESQDCVSFLLERSPYYMFSVLSVLSIGAVFVPLDDAHPDERIQYMLSDTGSKVLIVSDETYERARSLVEENVVLLNISDIICEDLACLDYLPVSYGDLACILYTSGTTGVPKGVKVPRKAIVNLADFYVKTYGLTADGVFGLYSSIGFDAAYKAIFAAVFAGACLDVIPNDVKLDMDALNEYFINQGINHVDITTPVAKLLTNQINDIPLDVLFTGGDKLGEFNRALDCRFVDGYGPTEAYVEVSTIDVKNRIDPSSIGHLIDNVKAYVLDKEFRRVPIGAIGELYLAGSQIAKGYLNREEETSQAFIKNPFEENSDYSILYRTGDLVHILPDGSLAIVGRSDSQVKVRGNRVELSEVEAIIRGFDYVDDVTVQAIENGDNHELVAYVVPAKALADLKESICDDVKGLKPDYMVPSFVIELNEIPLNVNGKVDKKALPEVDLDILREEYVAARNEIEGVIVNAFEKVLDQERVGVYDDFISLGGDSLKAIQLLAYLKDYDVSAADILNLRTPYGISKVLKRVSLDLDIYTIESGCPLNESQLNVYLDIVAKEKVDSYVINLSMNIPGVYDVDRIMDGLSEMIEVHPILGMCVSDDFDVPYLFKGSNPEILLKSDIDAYSMTEFLSRPFDLHDSLCRFMIVENDDDYSLFAVFHHIIFDALSDAVFKQDLLSILQGKNVEIDDSFLKVAAFNQEIEKTDEYAEAHDFYESMLVDSEDAGVLLDSVISDGNGFVQCDLDLNYDLFKSFLIENRISENALFTGVFAYTLSRFVGNDKVLFNIIENGRDRFNNFNSIGMFVNTLPLLVDCRNQEISSFLDSVSNTVYDAMRYNFYPFRLMAKEYGIDSSIIFQFMPEWVSENENSDDFDLLDYEDDSLMDSAEDLISDFVVELIESGQSYSLNVEYSGKYSNDFIRSFIESYKLILNEMINSVNLTDISSFNLANINCVTMNDIELLDTYNQTEHELDYDDILDAFNDNLAKYPDNNLVSMHGKTYSYAEGAYIADAIAKELLDLGITGEDFVGFLTERSEHYLFATLGILSIGAIYVPLDNAHPNERIKFMIEDTGSKVIIVSDGTYERAKKLTEDISGNISLLNISELTNEDIGTLSHLPVSYGDLACILYTSGTTGIPKGVKSTRKSFLNVVSSYHDQYEMDRDDVYGLYSAIGFDAGSLAMAQTIYSGACLSIIPEDIKSNMDAMNEYFLKENISHTMITTQVGKLFMDSVNNDSLDVLLVGGEKLGEFDNYNDYCLVDGFGPTEAFSFVSVINNDDKLDYSSIGKMNYNTKAYVLDKELRRVPVGAVGELCLAGYQIAEGYLNRDEETSKAFIENPFSDDEEYSRLYRSGDMVRLLPDGSYAIVGRRDSQVKIRGNRVELSEVESAIRELDCIEDVTIQTIKYGTNNELVAYVVPLDDIPDDELDDIVCDYVRETKPEYMIPSFVIKLDNIPLNVNGKVDKKALPEVDLDSLKADYFAPQSENEKLIVDAFEKVFGQEHIGIYDDFITLGGDSLIAIKLMRYLKGYNISAADILSLKTPKAIAEFIKDDGLDLDIFSLENGCPLNESQLNVYLDIVAGSKVDSYLVQFSHVIPKEHSLEDIFSALNGMFDAHPILRMCISDDFEVPYMVNGDLPSIDYISCLDNDYVMKFLAVPFDLKNSLSRFLIVETEDEYVLFVVLHHLISDALSLGAFKNDFRTILEGGNLELDDSFLKVAAFNHQIQETKEFEEAKQFYDRMLAESDEINVLLDDVRMDGPGYISDKLTMDIDGFLAQGNVSANVLFTSAFAYTLSRFVGDDNVLFNVLENGRSRFDNFNSIGMYVNTLPLLVDCSNQDVDSFLEYMSDLIYGVMKYNYYPFRLLANDYGVDSSILFQYFPNWIGDDSDETDYVGGMMDELTDDMDDVVGDMVVYLYQGDGEYEIHIDYSDKFSNEFIQGFVESYKMVLEDIINVDKLDEINYTSASDLDFYDSFNQNDHDLKYGSILEAFNDHLSKAPKNIFTISDEISYTYEESAYLINQIRLMLEDNGLDSEDRLAVFVDRNHWLPLSALACISESITYIPIDGSYPDQRISFMINQSSSKAIIITDSNQSRTEDLIREYDLDLKIINVSSLSDVVGTSSHVDYADESVNPIACIIYTSGTTGTPKAVQMTKRQIVNFMQFYADTTGFNEGSVQGIFVSVGFDISLELFVSVFGGGAVTFVPEEIRLDLIKLNQYYIRYNVTHTFITTQIAKLFVKTISETSLKYLRTGGEKLGSVEPPQNYILTDLYGPAEYNAITAMDIDKRIYESSVGILNWNTKTYILDKEHRRVPLGAVGEIYVSGYQTTVGYLDNVEANKKVLFENPFDGDIPGYERMYKTGDVARYLPDGTMGIVGRRDSQVKIRGNRVELSEVEITIRSFDYVEDVTVQTMVHDGNKELVAYVVMSNDFDGDITDYIQENVNESKPNYMVPSFVVNMDKIPLTVNGKVDKRSLPSVDMDSLRVGYVAPSSATEKLVVNAFEKVFSQGQIGIYDDFVSLGGDSLIAIKLMSILAKESIDVSFNLILEARTPYAIASYIDENDGEYGFVLAKKGNIDQNMFLIPPIGGLSAIFSKLIDMMEFEGNIYSIDDVKYSLPLDELKEISSGDFTLDSYYQAIEKLFSDGDIIVGYSLGCVFSLLLAEKLEKDNKFIGKCVLIDSDLLFERKDEVETDDVINEFVGDLDAYPDDFKDKFSEIVRINSNLNFNTPKIDSSVMFLSTEDCFESRISEISSDYEYIHVDSTHQRIINEDIIKIIKFFNEL